MRVAAISPSFLLRAATPPHGLSAALSPPRTSSCLQVAELHKETGELRTYEARLEALEAGSSSAAALLESRLDTLHTAVGDSQRRVVSLLSEQSTKRSSDAKRERDHVRALAS